MSYTASYAGGGRDRDGCWVLQRSGVPHLRGVAGIVDTTGCVMEAQQIKCGGQCAFEQGGVPLTHPVMHILFVASYPAASVLISDSAAALTLLRAGPAPPPPKPE